MSLETAAISSLDLTRAGTLEVLKMKSTSDTSSRLKRHHHGLLPLLLLPHRLS